MNKVQLGINMFSIVLLFLLTDNLLCIIHDMTVL